MMPIAMVVVTWQLSLCILILVIKSTCPKSVGEHEEIEEAEKLGSQRTSQRRGSQSDEEEGSQRTSQHKGS